MKLNWTKCAIDDLRRIEREASRFSDHDAKILIDRLFHKAGCLMVTPYLGALSEAYPDDDVRELYEDPYRIFYRIESERIDIVAVMHSAKRLPRKL